MAPEHCRSGIVRWDLHPLHSLSLQVHNLESTYDNRNLIYTALLKMIRLTIGLDEEKKIGVGATPLAIDDMRLELRFELDSLSLDVPNDQNFVVGGLGEHVRVGRTPADRSDVFVREGQQFGQLKGLLVVNVDRQRRCKGKSVLRARQHLLFPDLHTGNCDFLLR